MVSLPNHLQGGSVMKKLIVQFMFAMVIGVSMISLSYAADLNESPTLKTIKGDLAEDRRGILRGEGYGR